MLVTVLAAGPKAVAKIKGEEPENRYGSHAGCSWGAVLSVVIQLGIIVMAVWLAYTCNKRSGKHSPILMAILAFFFSEIYLIQAGIRYLMGDYDCSSPMPPLLGARRGRYLQTPEFQG